MASPFRVFRKYQKALLVGAGVILMFVFVIGDALVGYLGGSRGGGGGEYRDARATAVTWDGGSLSNLDIDQLVHRRHIINTFLRYVHDLGIQSAVMAGVEPRPLRVRPLSLPDNAQQGVERSVVQTKLLADAARDAGMSISDEAVMQYLNELGRGKVTSDDMREILKQLEKGGWRVTSDFIINALREEMLAQNYIASHLYAFQTVTPQERWTDWLRANDQVVVEAAAIPVDSFMIDVKDPTGAELQKFYDEWKDREASPELVGGMELPSATPGFRVPRKIDVQYIEANFDKFMTEIEGTITDEEIEKFYNENKDMFVKAADVELMEETEAIEETEDTETPATKGETPEASPPATESESESAPPAETSEGETPPATEGQPEEEAAPEAGTTPEPGTDGEQPPATGESQPRDEERATPAEGDQSSREGDQKSVFRLAAFLQEGAAEGASEQPAGASEDPAAGEPPASETAAGTEAAPAEAAETPVTDAATEAAATPATETGESSAAQPVATDSTSATAATDKPKEYQPLEDVKDIIRRRLAGDRVHEELTKRMNDIAGVLESEYGTYLGKKLDADGEKGEVPAPSAALTDLAPLAEKQGFTFAKTGPMPWLELRNTPVGKSGNATYASQTSGALPLSSVLFGTKELDLYEPIQTVDIDGNHYIAMKISDVQGKVPELKDIREEVVLAYKKQKAAELALKDAEAQAKTAQESRSSLADFFADNRSIKVVQTDPFSQLTRGDALDQFGRQPFRFSQPDEIVAPGVDFLRKVFDLKEGEVAAVLNNDHSIAYVVRIVEHVNSEDELRTAYLAEANTWEGLPTLMGEHFQMAQQMLFNDVVQKSNLDWVRDPDPRPQDEVVD